MFALVLFLFLNSKVSHEDCLGELISHFRWPCIHCGCNSLETILASTLFPFFLPLDPIHPFYWRLLHAHLDAFRFRSRCYFIWLLVDSICNLAGLGFDGYDKLGNPKWGLVSNVHAMEVELALNFRVVATRWNALSSNWMRR